MRVHLRAQAREANDVEEANEDIVEFLGNIPITIATIVRIVLVIQLALIIAGETPESIRGANGLAIFWSVQLLFLTRLCSAL